MDYQQQRQLYFWIFSKKNNLVVFAVNNKIYVYQINSKVIFQIFFLFVLNGIACVFLTRSKKNLLFLGQLLKCGYRLFL